MTQGINKSSRIKLRCWRVTTGEVLFGNIPGAMAQEIAILGLNEDTEGDVEKANILAGGKYQATTFLLRSDMTWYGDLILSLKTTTPRSTDSGN